MTRASRQPRVPAARSWGELVIACTAVALFAPKAHAQAGGGSADVHHVELLGGLAAMEEQGGYAVRPTTAATIPCVGPCEVPVATPRTGGTAWSLRLGYRFRPFPYVELGVSPELDLYPSSHAFSLPLLVHARVPFPDGSGMTLGFGGGVSSLRSDRPTLTETFVRAEAGGTVRVARAWSLVFLVHVSASPGGLRSTRDFEDPGRHLRWAGWAVGLRRSF